MWFKIYLKKMFWVLDTLLTHRSGAKLPIEIHCYLLSGLDLFMLACTSKKNESAYSTTMCFMQFQHINFLYKRIKIQQPPSSFYLRPSFTSKQLQIKKSQIHILQETVFFYARIRGQIGFFPLKQEQEAVLPLRSGTGQINFLLPQCSRSDHEAVLPKQEAVLPQWSRTGSGRWPTAAPCATPMKREGKIHVFFSTKTHVYCIAFLYRKLCSIVFFNKV